MILQVSHQVVFAIFAISSSHCWIYWGLVDCGGEEVWEMFCCVYQLGGEGKVVVLMICLTRWYVFGVFPL